LSSGDKSNPLQLLKWFFWQPQFIRILMTIPMDVVIKQTKNEVSIENSFVKYSISLSDGCYTGTDKLTDTNIFEDASFRLDCAGNDVWPGEELTYSWEQEPINDNFGKGNRVKIFYSPKQGYKPAWILLISLYEEHPFAVLGWGIKNTQSYAIRVCDVELLFGGELFVDQEVADPHVLKGGAGAEPNFVDNHWEIEALNNALLTYKDGESRKSIVAGGLKYQEFARRVEFLDGVKKWNNNGDYDFQFEGFRQMTLACWDPQGKLIQPNTTYISEDTFYLDISTSDPFISLEQYGQAMRVVNKARPNCYDFPTLCGWMISTANLGEGKPINNSPGLVDQMDKAQEKGFMKYSKLAVRLEPDFYCYTKNGNTQQGWWDDEHWAQFGSLKEPYESFEKWCKAVQKKQGVPFTYFQVSMPSNDFALAHPDWMLNQDISRLHVQHAHHRPLIRYDYSHPEFREYVLNVWKRHQKGGLEGIKFDYPETGWTNSGGFIDKSFTTTSAYREIFRLCREGLGPDAFIHERNLGGNTHEDAPRLDVTAGIVDLQRVWGDASHFEPEMGSRMGLRWYKNRVVFQYYPDGKSLYEKGSEIPLATHKRRTFLTLIGLLSGRLELGTSIGRMTPEMFHDVTRLFPMINEPKSPRPVDMFLGKRHPETYVYEVSPQWWQVLLINNDIKNDQTISAPLSGSQPETGSLGLDPSKSYHIFDFWNQKYLGQKKGTENLVADLKSEECLLVSVREVLEVPQIISTNRHIMQGMMELKDTTWDNNSNTLSGNADVIGDEDFILTIATNGKLFKECVVDTGECHSKNRADGKGLIDLTLRSKVNKTIAFKIQY
jgi:hypothetical protein